MAVPFQRGQKVSARVELEQAEAEAASAVAEARRASVGLYRQGLVGTYFGGDNQNDLVAWYPDVPAGCSTFVKTSVICGLPV
jgi:ketol-acid reductoisomerase